MKVKEMWGPKSYELEKGNCECEKIAYDEIVYVWVSGDLALPFHVKCNRIIDYYDWHFKNNREM